MQIYKLLIRVLIVPLFLFFILNITNCLKIKDVQDTVAFDSRMSRLVSGYEDLPDFNELFFSGGKGYEFKNENSDKLLIVVEGSGWKSMPTGFLKLFLKPLYNSYNIFLVEKFFRSIGKDYWDCPEDRDQYTIENLLVNYYEVISEYLFVNNFDTIAIAGHSEGAYLLPLLYNKLENANIVALISSAGGGGLTYFEGLHVLREHAIKGSGPFALLNILEFTLNNA